MYGSAAYKIRAHVLKIFLSPPLRTKNYRKSSIRRFRAKNYKRILLTVLPKYCQYPDTQEVISPAGSGRGFTQLAGEMHGLKGSKGSTGGRLKS